jgi:hypothetical protein
LKLARPSCVGQIEDGWSVWLEGFEIISRRHVLILNKYIYYARTRHTLRIEIEIQRRTTQRAATQKAFLVVYTMVDTSAFGESNASAAAENVAELQFGPEFEDIHILSNAQVAVILQVSANSAVSRDEELNEVYRKTQKYVNRFNTMTNPEKEHQELVDELDNLQE